MDSPQAISGECDGVPFTMTKHWSFLALEREFSSYEELRTYVEQRRKAEAAQERRQLELPAIHNDGERTTITGLHAGHGGVLCKPRLKNGSQYSQFYPDVPWIIDALRERHDLRCRAVQLDNILKKFQIDTYAGRFSIENHAAIVEKMADSHVIKTRAAQATSLEMQKAATPMPTSGIRV